jgi:hypothetical protein
MNFRGNNRRIEKLAAASAEAVPMACQAGEVVRQWRETGEFSFPDKSPDGSERYLVDEAILGSLTERLGGDLADPLKTTVVQNQRSMTTWVLRKKLP